jgi:hypothetical protein
MWKLRQEDETGKGAEYRKVRVREGRRRVGTISAYYMHA